MAGGSGGGSKPASSGRWLPPSDRRGAGDRTGRDSSPSCRRRRSARRSSRSTRRRASASSSISAGSSATGRRLDAAFGIRHRGAVARLQVVAPHPLDDREAVPHRGREHAGEVPRGAHQRARACPAGCGATRRRRCTVDRVEVPAVDHDVVRPRRALADLFPEAGVHPLLHRRQQPGLEQRCHRLGRSTRRSGAPGVGAGRRRDPRTRRAATRSSAWPGGSRATRRHRSPIRCPGAYRARPRSVAPRARPAAPGRRRWRARAGAARSRRHLRDRPLVARGRPRHQPIAHARGRRSRRRSGDRR